MSSVVVLTVDGVSKKFARGFVGARRSALRDIWREFALWDNGPRERLNRSEFWALHNISFELREGEALGIIGSNGAGKSTLLKVLSRLLKPDTGEVHIAGKVGTLIELGAGFNPVLTGRENVFAQGALYNYSARQMAQRLEAIVDFAAIGEAIDKPVQHYSSGMRARLGFAVAVHVDPKVLLVDEVLAVGDLAFQNKCMRYMRSYRDRGGTLVFVGHAGHQVQAACDRALVLDHGRCVFDGDVIDALDDYFRRQASCDAMPVAAGGGDAALVQSVAGSSSTVAISDVNLYGIGGALSTDSPAGIRVAYVVDRPLPAAWLFCGFYSIDGQRALAGAAVEIPGGLVIGAGRLHARLPRLPFTEGSYQLRMAIIDAELAYPVALKGWVDPPMRITVAGGASVISNFSRILDMPVLIPIEITGSDDAQR